MKKFVLILLCILLFISIFPTAYAEGEVDKYYKITQDGVSFLRLHSKDVLFTLEKGVYVKFLNSEGLHYKVEYCGIEGLVLASSITDTNFYTNLPQYYHTDITIHFTDTAVSSGSNYVRFISSSPAPYSPMLSTSDDLKLIGKYHDGSNQFLFVSCNVNNQTYNGYVLKNDTDWNENINPITPPIEITTGTGTNGSISAPNASDTPTTVEPTNNLVRVILIIGICIPAFLIVYLIFKPVTPSKRDSARRSQTDYEDFE